MFCLPQITTKKFVSLTSLLAFFTIYSENYCTRPALNTVLLKLNYSQVYIFNFFKTGREKNVFKAHSWMTAVVGVVRLVIETLCEADIALVLYWVTSCKMLARHIVVVLRLFRRLQVYSTYKQSSDSSVCRDISTIDMGWSRRDGWMFREISTRSPRFASVVKRRDVWWISISNSICQLLS